MRIFADPRRAIVTEGSDGRVARLSSAKAATAVRIRFGPHRLNGKPRCHCDFGASSFLGANTLQSVPWQVSYNGSILSEAELSDYITLDVATGASLEDWSMSTELAFKVLQAGCYDVPLENGAL